LLLPAPAAAAKRPVPRNRGPFVLQGVFKGYGELYVKRANRRVRQAGLLGRSVTIDFRFARVSVGDANEDGRSSMSDVEPGDRLQVRARRLHCPNGHLMLVAYKVVDMTRPKPADPQGDAPSEGGDEPWLEEPPFEDGPAEGDPTSGEEPGDAGGAPPDSFPGDLFPPDL
jgi:hypothetical protein